MAKQRADQLLVTQGLAESRTLAQRLIMAGLVYVGEKRIDKPGQTLPEDTEIILRGREHPYVSRGGVKLAAGLDHFGFPVEGRLALDVGASTGGFTDVLLQRGARHVYAVDVGRGQLDQKLREDPRVTSLEQTNARALTKKEIPEAPGIIVCDASFISLKLVLPAALALAAPGAWGIALIKPQFEVGPKYLVKGVVKNDAVRQAAVDDLTAWFAALESWKVMGVTESPLKGPAGNTEYLIGIVRE